MSEFILLVKNLTAVALGRDDSDADGVYPVRFCGLDLQVGVGVGAHWFRPDGSTGTLLLLSTSADDFDAICDSGARSEFFQLLDRLAAGAGFVRYGDVEGNPVDQVIETAETRPTASYISTGFTDYAVRQSQGASK